MLRRYRKAMAVGGNRGCRVSAMLASACMLAGAGYAAATPYDSYQAGDWKTGSTWSDVPGATEYPDDSTDIATIDVNAVTLGSVTQVAGTNLTVGTVNYNSGSLSLLGKTGAGLGTTLTATTHDFNGGSVSLNFGSLKGNLNFDANTTVTLLGAGNSYIGTGTGAADTATLTGSGNLIKQGTANLYMYYTGASWTGAIEARAGAIGIYKSSTDTKQKVGPVIISGGASVTDMNIAQRSWEGKISTTGTGVAKLGLKFITFVPGTLPTGFDDLASTGVIAPGGDGSVGTLTVTSASTDAVNRAGALKMLADSKYVVDVTGATTADLLTARDTTPTSNGFVLNVVSGADLEVHLWDPGVATTVDAMIIQTVAGGLFADGSTSNTVAFDITTPGAAAGWSTPTLTRKGTTNQLWLQATYVPEPGTLGLLGLAGPALLLRRRQRTR